jgi:hypothetical protein
MKYTQYVLISLTVFIACKKSNTGNPAPASSEVTVYVSGSSYNNTKMAWVAAYWEDSVQHYLTNGDQNAFANAVFYSGNQLYVGGQSLEWFPTPGLWVNGTGRDMSSPDISAIGKVNSIYVSGTDIYLAGSGPNANGEYVNGFAQGKLWKNGITTPVGNDSISEATAVAVSGTDVYVAWWAIKTNGRFSARYNKNGETFILDSSDTSTPPTAMCVSGSDLYISGNKYDTVSQHYFGVYWKNGMMLDIQANNDATYASGIAVSGGDVYISGSINISGVGHASYWKNGQVHLLNDGTSPATTSGIAVSGTDVYVSGMEGGIPKYWKNGISQTLSCDPAFEQRTTGIFVVKK